MQMLKHPFVKKFLFIYLSAVVLVLGYFFYKSFFTQEKVIELKSFDTRTKELKKPEKVKEEPKAKFLLLPKSTSQHN